MVEEDDKSDESGPNKVVEGDKGKYITRVNGNICIWIIVNCLITFSEVLKDGERLFFSFSI